MIVHSMVEGRGDCPLNGEGRREGVIVHSMVKGGGDCPLNGGGGGDCPLNGGGKR